MKVKNNAVLDNNFDLDGWKLYNIGGSSQEEYLLNGAMMPDGNILKGGNQGSGDTVYFCLLMVKPDGSMDNNFAPNGVHKHIFGANNNNSSSALALSNDGKIYLGGYTRTCANGTCGPLSSGIARYMRLFKCQMPSYKHKRIKNHFNLSNTCISENQWISLDIDHIEKQSIEIVNLNGQSISFELFQNKIKLLNTSQGIYLLKIKNKHDYQTVKILQL